MSTFIAGAVKILIVKKTFYQSWIIEVSNTFLPLLLNHWEHTDMSPLYKAAGEKTNQKNMNITVTQTLKQMVL